MLLIAGLGNPGARYRRTRHNIGFMAVDEIARRHGIGGWRARFSGEAATSSGPMPAHSTHTAGTHTAHANPQPWLLLKPATHMNESGRAVAAARRFYKIPLPSIWVIHDDIDLPLGKVRVKHGGGAGGHNGLRSIDAHIGRDYGRVRLGVGRPAGTEAHGHVLSDFAAHEGETVTRMLAGVAEFLPLLPAGRESDFMSKIAMRMQPPPSKDKDSNATHMRGAS